MKTKTIEEMEKVKILQKTIKKAIIEALEEAGLVKAIDEGLKTKKASREEVFKILNKSK